MIILDAFVSFLLIAAFTVSAFNETRNGYRSKFIGFIISLVGAIGYTVSIFAKKFDLILAYSGLGTIILGGIYILIFNDLKKLRKEKTEEYITPFRK